MPRYACLISRFEHFEAWFGKRHFVFENEFHMEETLDTAWFPPDMCQAARQTLVWTIRLRRRTSNDTIVFQKRERRKCLRLGVPQTYANTFHLTTGRTQTYVLLSVTTQCSPSCWPISVRASQPWQGQPLVGPHATTFWCAYASVWKKNNICKN